MGTLADQLAEVQVTKPRKIPKAPCFSIYGYGDEEDRQAIEKLRADGAEWLQVQEIIDGLVGVESPLPNHKFIRHWSKKCSCWDEE